MKKIDYSNIDPNNFTQKDLMIHLLNVSQHTVTRDELKDDNYKLEHNLSEKIDAVVKHTDQRFEQTDKILVQIDKRFDSLEKSIDKRFEQVDQKIDKLDAKFDKLQWFLVVGALVILFKEQILALLH